MFYFEWQKKDVVFYLYRTKGDWKITHRKTEATHLNWLQAWYWRLWFWLQRKLNNPAFPYRSVCGLLILKSCA